MPFLAAIIASPGWQAMPLANDRRAKTHIGLHAALRRIRPSNLLPGLAEISGCVGYPRRVFDHQRLDATG
jgi:hypothetical protein